MTWEEIELYGYVHHFLNENERTNSDDSLNICKYVMEKYEVKWGLDSFKKKLWSYQVLGVAGM